MLFNKRSFAVLLLLVLLTAAISAQASSEEERSFYFQLGLGFAGVSYPPEHEAAIDELDAVPGVDRTRLNLHVALGHIISQNLYGILLIDATGDRLDDGFNYIQTNTYFFNGGIRAYPFETGLILGAHAGPARMVLDTDFVGNVVSEWGFGGGVMAGYDFDPTLTGFSGIIGIRINGASIEGDSVGTASLFLSLLWK